MVKQGVTGGQDEDHAVGHLSSPPCSATGLTFKSLLSLRTVFPLVYSEVFGLSCLYGYFIYI